MTADFAPDASAEEWRGAYFALAKIAQGQIDRYLAIFEQMRRAYERGASSDDLVRLIDDAAIDYRREPHGFKATGDVVCGRCRRSPFDPVHRGPIPTPSVDAMRDRG
jgi:hypothetical protein